MSSTELVDNILTAVIGKLGDEVGNLLGEQIRFAVQGNRIVTKDDFFAESRDPSALIRMEVTGDRSGESYALLRLRDAILLGGSLIMLPAEQIEEKIAGGHLDGEEANAFGEIASSIASTCTHTFLDQAEEKLRFAMTAVTEVVPAEIAAAAAEPFSPGSYYLCQAAMTFKDEDLGSLEFLFPLELLGLAGDQDGAETTEEGDGEDYSDSRTTDRTLFAALQQIQDQISGFLGQDLIFSEHGNRFVTKEEFFTPPPDYGVVTKMVVSGAADGLAYILVDLKSAIILGATLIMRPPDQIAKRLVKATLDGEEADAFGEIANLAAGVYAQVFPETHPRKLHFKRDDVFSFDGEAIDLKSDEPVPPGTYYLSSCSMHLGEQDLGRFDVLFPLDVLGIEPPRPKTAPADKPEEQEGAAGGVVLIVADDDEQAQAFAENLTGLGLTCQNMTFQDNFREAIREQSVAGVFLIMAEVEDQAFATAIKIRSELQDDQPMIVAGPQWTRSKVLKALKYGACDILITPAETEDIIEKARRHLAKVLEALH